MSDPTSKQYRHFLTPAQVRARFGPTAAQVTKVHAWLAENGLKTVGENDHWIDVSGTPEKMTNAFGRMPRLRVDPGGDYGARAAAAVPAALAGTVSSVAGLVPQTHGMRQLYRVVTGPRDGGSGPGSGVVNPGGPMQPTGPVAPPARVDPGGPMQPAPVPVIIGAPATRALPADPGDPTLATTSSTRRRTDR